MAQIWNEIELKIPPLITLKVQDTSFVKQVRSLFLKRKTNQFDFLQNELAHSAALISRLMARRKNSFHNMSGFKFVCKLNAALCRLLKLDIEQTLDNFFQMLPDVSSYNPNEVPSRNNLDFILIRLISLNKIYQRISSCCLESASYFNGLLKNSFFIETVTLFIAVIAKLRDLTHKLGNIYTSFYKKLLAFRILFPKMNSHTSFEKFVFPKELEQFSKQKSFTEMTSNSKTNDNTTIKMQKEKVQVMPIAALASVLPKLEKEEDFGMPISRESMKPVIDLGSIHNIEDVRKFFKEEDEKRNKCLNSCATKYILKHEWLAIQKLVERKIIANDHKKALSVFRKFISSKT